MPAHAALAEANFGFLQCNTEALRGGRLHERLLSSAALIA
jgi:hypothetical protein